MGIWIKPLAVGGTKSKSQEIKGYSLCFRWEYDHHPHTWTNCSPTLIKEAQGAINCASQTWVNMVYTNTRLQIRVVKHTHNYAYAKVQKCYKCMCFPLEIHNQLWWRVIFQWRKALNTHFPLHSVPFHPTVCLVLFKQAVNLGCLCTASHRRPRSPSKRYRHEDGLLCLDEPSKLVWCCMLSVLFFTHYPPKTIKLSWGFVLFCKLLLGCGVEGSGLEKIQVLKFRNTDVSNTIISLVASGNQKSKISWKYVKLWCMSIKKILLQRKFKK